ncbi:hypothetical protein QFZ52_000123 [Arthrobacter woluwensis]|nr:hypothetical protein [Arthrobacter woluwensis]
MMATTSAQDQIAHDGPERQMRCGRAEVQRAEGEEHAVTADDEHFRVGEVDEVEDAIHEGVAQGYKSVDGAEGEAVERGAPEVLGQGVDVEGDPGVVRGHCQWHGVDEAGDCFTDHRSFLR